MQDLMYIGWPIVLPFIVAVISLFLLFNNVPHQKGNNAGYGKIPKLTIFVMLFVWSVSWGLYMAAITLNVDAQTGTLEKIFRSAVSAIGLFAFSIDSNVLDGIPDKGLLKDCVSVMAFLAGTCTILLFIIVVSRRFYASLKLQAASRFVCLHRSQVYVFWGWNQQARLLAESIRKHHELDGDYWIVIAEPNLLADTDETTSVQDSITKLFTHKSSTLQEANRSHTLLAIASGDLTRTTTNRTKSSASDMLGLVGLEAVAKLITAKDVKAHLFFLSDDEEYNVACVRSLTEDAINAGDNVTYYCKARKNDIFKTIEDFNSKKDMTIELIDTSHLSVEALKRDVNHHPVKLVNIDPANSTTISEDFASLIVGFDSTGRDALRFLYEFGAFVDSRSTNEKTFRSPFHCTVVDKDLSSISAAFKVNSPSAVAAQNADGTPLIHFVEYDYNSEDFYSHVLKPIADKVNAIFIAVGDNLEGVKLSIQLFKYLRQRRSDMSRLRIYVRCYTTEQEDLVQQVADHYNEGCGQQDNPVIIPFGKETDLFSYKQIVDTEFRDKGKIYQEAYIKLRNENGDLWDLRHALKTGKKRKVKKKDNDRNTIDVIEDVKKEERTINLDELSSLRRQEHQDESNALHALTKMYLLRQSLPNLNVSDFLLRYFALDEQRQLVKAKSEGFGSSRHYTELSDKENTVIHNLAVLEHLRWNASHELLGYVRVTEGTHSCDERTMQHNCLRDWQELDEESRATSKAEGWDADYISYDFTVVDTTIKMNLKR